MSMVEMSGFTSTSLANRFKEHRDCITIPSQEHDEKTVKVHKWQILVIAVGALGVAALVAMLGWFVVGRIEIGTFLPSAPFEPYP